MRYPSTEEEYKVAFPTMAEKTTFQQYLGNDLLCVNNILTDISCQVNGVWKAGYIRCAENIYWWLVNGVKIGFNEAQTRIITVGGIQLHKDYYLYGSGEDLMINYIGSSVKHKLRIILLYQNKFYPDEREVLAKCIKAKKEDSICVTRIRGIIRDIMGE